MKRLRDEPASPAAALELQKFLHDTSNHVVAAAAALAVLNDDARFRESVAAAVSRRESDALRALFATKFPPATVARS
ncbi:MAG: hypothetical protein ACM3U2_02500 [Deltaproteobacteria bacterium]